PRQCQALPSGRRSQTLRVLGALSPFCCSSRRSLARAGLAVRSGAISWQTATVGKQRWALPIKLTSIGRQARLSFGRATVSVVHVTSSAWACSEGPAGYPSTVQRRYFPAVGSLLRGQLDRAVVILDK